MTRALLIALSLSISACASVDVPEVGRQLRDYQRESLTLDQPVTIAGELEFEVVEGQLCALEGQDAALDAYTAACEANSEALEAAGRGVARLNDENAALLYAGQAAEAQAELWRGMYVDEANRCRLITAGAGAAGGFLLLVLGLGAAF